ncbi:hypothetical protein DNTS_015014 [Danionella cerebrum]|uniref:Synaptonemal complex central element protein 3 n=1 Tax=Danionella cerebrum TaxID=2873325 RepID=A0A553QFV0_9TELE|nr:hypothetical protein DNTS_015014 [Danionella translucida]
MSDGDVSSAQIFEDFSHENLRLNPHLEKMIDEMEEISVKLSCMAYDMVVLRTNADLAESLKNLENEFLKCKNAILGPTDHPDKKCLSDVELNIPEV